MPYYWNKEEDGSQRLESPPPDQEPTVGETTQSEDSTKPGDQEEISIPERDNGENTKDQSSPEVKEPGREKERNPEEDNPEEDPREDVTVDQQPLEHKEIPLALGISFYGHNRKATEKMMSWRDQYENPHHEDIMTLLVSPSLRPKTRTRIKDSDQDYVEEVSTEKK
ncbi:hypothetical protein BDF14DRAFT_1852149 [Spinellus fusiger]|nr:hypothetical protein BDF14DRAFT_1852149 [Spinellus fusiger]